MPGYDGSLPVHSLDRIIVRPIRDEERARWQACLQASHYLPSHHLVGTVVRHVAHPWDEPDAWAAVLAWTAASLACKTRDAWIGWTRDQRYRRIRHVIQNARFAITSQGRTANAASCILAKSLRRIPGDWHSATGYEPWLAESYVDAERYLGTCYQAAGWDMIGLSHGFGRCGGQWHHHGHRRSIYLRNMVVDAYQRLVQGSLLDGTGHYQIPAAHWSHLPDLILQMPCTGIAMGKQGVCYRDRRGLMALILIAQWAGAETERAIAEQVRRMPFHVLRTAGCSRSTGGHQATPSRSTIRRLLRDMEGLEDIRHFANRWREYFINTEAHHDHRRAS